jgi:hypothetical protein
MRAYCASRQRLPAILALDGGRSKSGPHRPLQGYPGALWKTGNSSHERHCAYAQFC